MARQTASPGRVLRLLTLGSGPLKRASDRLEVLSCLALAAMVPLAVAVAVAVATATFTHGRLDVTAQRADRQQVVAQLQEDASAVQGFGGEVDAGEASAAWIAPSGAARTGPVPARVAARAGSTVLIWIDPDGDRTSRPVSTGDVVGVAVGAALLTFIGISALALGAHLVVRRLLDRSRSRRWAAEWALVGPEWSRRVA